MQRIPFYHILRTTCRTSATSLDLAYRDGWTINGGIGHKLNDQWSVAGSVTWDRGTSQGFGSQTDTWIFGTGVSYTPTENVEFRLAGAVSLLTSGELRSTTGGARPTAATLFLRLWHRPRRSSLDLAQGSLLISATSN
ncbi:MAG: hypothetical protein U5N27_21310 [Rhizobium sp.]|nr:hypothetical protein [Rhizobium sp.]